MSNGDSVCPSLAEDKDNVENVLPDQNLACSQQRKHSAKADGREDIKGVVVERQALTSLQLNSELGSETLKNLSPLDLVAESKQSPPIQVLEVKEEVRSVPDPVESSCNQTTSVPTSEETSSQATGVSSSEGTWKSCIDTPSPLHSVDQYDTAEDISSCSFEDLPSSKEVSFNLPPGYSEWVKSASINGQSAVPPLTSSVQTLSHIVNTVLENNPEIYPPNTGEPVDLNLTYENPEPEVVPSQETFPSAASHILQRSGVLRDSQPPAELSDSFSDLISKFSSLNVEDDRSFSVNNFSEAVDISPASNNSESESVKEFGATECSSISEVEVSPFVDASEDLSQSASLTPETPCSSEDKLPVDVQQADVVTCSEPLVDSLTEEKKSDKQNHSGEPERKVCVPEDSSAVNQVQTNERSVTVEGELSKQLVSSISDSPVVDVSSPSAHQLEPLNNSSLTPAVDKSLESAPQAVEETLASVPQTVEESLELALQAVEETLESTPQAVEGTLVSVPPAAEESLAYVPPAVEEPLTSIPPAVEETLESVSPAVAEPSVLVPQVEETSVSAPQAFLETLASVPQVVEEPVALERTCNNLQTEPAFLGEAEPNTKSSDLNVDACQQALEVANDFQPELIVSADQTSNTCNSLPTVAEEVVEDIHVDEVVETKEDQLCPSATDDIDGEFVESECIQLPISEALNTTDALFLEFNLQASDALTTQLPVRSLLDSTFSEGDLNRNQNCYSSTVSSEAQLFCPNSSEQVVLEVPAKEVLNVLKEQHDSCIISNHILPVEDILPNRIAKETAPEEPKETHSQDPSVNIFDDLPVVDTTEFELLVEEQQKVDTMPMHMMEAHLDHQWHQNDQMNTRVGDNNCDVDVNVNQCQNMQGNNYHHNDAILKSVNSDNGYSSVSSSPNKRKNDEDSAFEDLATVEDANSDLVDDHIMDDQVEEVGVAAVNRRSPSQTRLPEASPKTKVDSFDGSAKSSDLPGLNHSEAGPVVAEFTEEELKAAAEVFKDPSTFEFLEKVSNSKAFEESSLSRLSLYVKFDPLVSNRSQENQSRSTFKKPAAPQKKSVSGGEESSSRKEEVIGTANSASPPAHRRELDAQKLIDFHSPNAPQSLARANPKMVPVEPVQRIENMQHCKVFTEDDMKKAMKINELMFNERVIKKEKELAEAESKLKAQAEAAREQNSVLQESLAFTRRLLDESGVIMRQWQEKKELERVEVTRERDQALEDLRSVEASFSELHRRYEKIKAVLEGYKQNEEGLRVQLLDTQDKLRTQEQMYDALKEHTQEKLESANLEIENAKKAGGSELAVLHSQLMKAEMKVNSLEKSLEQKAQEYMQLTAIYDGLVARVSGQ